MITVVGFSLSVDECIAVPELVPGEHYRGRLAARQPAGKSVNVARALGHLGVECRLAGFVGRREAGYFAESLAALPVECDFIGVDAITRRATTILIEGTGQEVHITYPAFPVPATGMAKLRESLSRVLGHDDILAVSGSLAPGIGTDEFQTLISGASAAGAAVYVDTSGGALAAAVEAGPDGVRINRNELAEWYALSHGGGATSHEGALSALLAAGVGQAMVSAGAGGAVLAGPHGTLAARCAIDGQVHTVGAGDAQFAGWLAALERGETDPAARLRSALAVAAASLKQVMAGNVDRAEAEALAEGVEFLD